MPTVNCENSVMKKQRILQLIYGAVIAFIVLYAIAVSIYLGVIGGTRAVMSNLFGLALVCFAFCAVAIFSYFLSKNSRNRKQSREKKENGESIAQGEKTLSKHKGIAFLTSGICLAISCFLVAWAVTGIGVSVGLKDILGDGYVKVQATVVRSVQVGDDLENLVYEYTAADGKVYRSFAEASFGGIVFKAGKQVNLFYSVENPRVTANLSVPVFILLGAFLFLIGGIVAAVLSGNSQKRNNIGGYLVFTFFLLFGIGFYIAGGLASGLNVLELSLSGTGYYAITVFMLLGGLLDLLGFCYFIKKRLANKLEKIQVNADDVR